MTADNCYFPRTMNDEPARTIRQRMTATLEDGDFSARDLSRLLGIKEREVYDHLAHIAHSAAGRNRKLKVTPPLCLSCGYTFKDRRRLTRPGRCPRCQDTHIQDPLYRIV
ncbi:MAG: transcriptional regulator [Thermodesulfobacteriota bacterium]